MIDKQPTDTKVEPAADQAAAKPAEYPHDYAEQTARDWLECTRRAPQKFPYSLT